MHASRIVIAVTLICISSYAFVHKKDWSLVTGVYARDTYDSKRQEASRSITQQSTARSPQVHKRVRQEHHRFLIHLHFNLYSFIPPRYLYTHNPQSIIRRLLRHIHQCLSHAFICSEHFTLPEIVEVPDKEDGRIRQRPSPLPNPMQSFHIILLVGSL
jgi:hypothetical protein